MRQKKIIAFFLVIAILCTPAFAGLENFEKSNTYTPGMFTDVSSIDWFGSSVASAYELGLMKGDSADKFNPSGSVTLAQAITMASRIHSIYATGGESFEQGNPWYQVYVDYALNNKIISEGFANYNEVATRVQFASILAGALPGEALPAINTVEDNAIPDVPSSAPYSAPIYMLYRAGILTGDDSSGTFNPDSSIGRSAAAAIVTRLADSSARRSITLEYVPVLTAPAGLSATGGTKAVSLSWYDVSGASGYNVYISQDDETFTLKQTSETASAAISGLNDAATYYFKVSAYTVTSSGNKAEGPSTGSVKAVTDTAPISYSGNGSQVINNISIPYGPYYAVCTYSGTSNFIVKFYYGEKSYEYDSLANEIGNCATVTYLSGVGTDAVTNGSLEVKSQGDWTVEFKPVSGTTTTNISGSGSIVTGLFTAGASRYTVNYNHSGSRNFIVRIQKYNGRSFDYASIANEIGSCSGQVIANLDSGSQYFFVIQSKGDWTIDLGLGDTVTAYTPPAPPSGGSSGSGSDSGSGGTGGGGTGGGGTGGGDSGGSTGTKMGYTQIKEMLGHAQNAVADSKIAMESSIASIGSLGLDKVIDLNMAIAYGNLAKSDIKKALDIVSKYQAVNLTGSSKYSTLQEMVQGIYNYFDAISGITVTQDNAGEYAKLIQDNITDGYTGCVALQKLLTETLDALS